jgi:hypothetical protein
MFFQRQAAFMKEAFLSAWPTTCFYRVMPPQEMTASDIVLMAHQVCRPYIEKENKDGSTYARIQKGKHGEGLGLRRLRGYRRGLAFNARQR